MNKTILTGRLTRDLELKYLPGNGTAVATGTLAVDRKVKKEGAEADFVVFHLFGKQAEATVQFCGQKGMKMTIVGRLQTSSYKHKKYDDVTLYKAEVMVEEVEWLENKNRNTSSNTPAPTGGFGNDNFYPEITLVDDGDIPF